jgi:hypothetical protein
MSFFLTILFLFLQATTPKAHYGHHGLAVLPDPVYTPGIVRTTDVNVVCHQTTKSLRKPGLQEVYTLYGATKELGKCCEIDHLISLELGGDNGEKNEWPQPYEPRPGAHEKDEVENWLHAQVCANKIGLVAAQKEIARDWYEVYLRMKEETKHGSRKRTGYSSDTRLVILGRSSSFEEREMGQGF